MPDNRQVLVSVGIPTYNRSKLLSEAIRSILDQTIENFEIVVSDDCSPDNTEQVVRGFGDARVQYFRSAKQLGVPRNWNECVRRSRGEYFALLPDDDRYSADFLARMTSALIANPNAAFAQCGVVIEKSTGELVHAKDRRSAQDLSGEDALYWHLAGLACNPAGILFRRAIMVHRGLWREDYWDDWAFILKLAFHHGFTYVPEPLAFVRDHPENLSKHLAAAKRDGILDWVNQLADVFGSALPVTAGLLALRKREERRLSRACVRAAARKIGRGRWHEARALMTRAHQLYPLAIFDPLVFRDGTASLRQRFFAPTP